MHEIYSQSIAVKVNCDNAWEVLSISNKRHSQDSDLELSISQAHPLKPKVLLVSVFTLFFLMSLLGG